MSGIQRYATSKLANLMFAYELARRLQTRGITVNAFDPAAVPTTNLLQSVKSPLVRWSIRASTRLFSLFGVTVSTPEKSGSAMADLVLNTKYNEVTGRHFKLFEERKSSVQSYDNDLAKQLWNDSESLTKQ